MLATLLTFPFRESLLTRGFSSRLLAYTSPAFLGCDPDTEKLRANLLNGLAPPKLEGTGRLGG